MAEIAAMPSHHDVPCPGAPRRAAQVALWLPGLLVAAGAIAATAHGLYEVAIAAQVPPAIAWLYPVITDGLALVAYAAAARMQGPARRYSWAVVTTAAGLSGLAQAAYLAGDATLTAPAALHFGVGAWPAIAAAIVAHLLHLLATAPRPPQEAAVDEPPTSVFNSPLPFGRTPDTRSDRASSDLDVRRPQVSQRRSASSPSGVPEGPQPLHRRPRGRSAEAPARDRARAAADLYARRHGALPTVSRLQDQAEVSRGTAGDVLKAMREEANALRGRHPVHTAGHRPGPEPLAGGNPEHDPHEMIDVRNGRTLAPSEVHNAEVASSGRQPPGSSGVQVRSAQLDRGRTASG
ncbi:hypothetical protein SAMN05443637_1401 [Pseudonocardia thermophila]|uniref:DUF2637 domain-containing protein n=1 Tax=Pseudonocardia thermophila TaxID=1848 RepID=A0A1M7BHB2_PSETH|nr:hypothetical protein SAMN05443637_1401 [Pseudonocardia thermophila]